MLGRQALVVLRTLYENLLSMMALKKICFLVFLYVLYASGRLPTIVEDRPDGSKDIFRVNPHPPMLSGEILIPNSIEVSDLEYIFNYKEEKWVDSFQPFWITKTVMNKAATEKNCKALFGSGKMTFKGYRADYRADNAQWVYSTSGHVELDVKPYSTGSASQQQISLNRIRGNCDPQSFTGCWAIPERKQIPYLIINSKKMSALMTGTCDFCAIGACATSCPNGKYASAYALLEPESNLQMSDLACIPCKNGTWNTCNNKQDCFWSVNVLLLFSQVLISIVFAGTCLRQVIMMSEKILLH